MMVKAVGFSRRSWLVFQTTVSNWVRPQTSKGYIEFLCHIRSSQFLVPLQAGIFFFILPKSFCLFNMDTTINKKKILETQMKKYF